VHKQKEEDGVFAAEEAAAQEKADRDHAIARVANAENKTEAHTISVSVSASPTCEGGVQTVPFC
jgi:hypothetical protein